MFRNRFSLFIFRSYLPLLLAVVAMPAHAGITDWPSGPNDPLFLPDAMASEAQRQEKNATVYREFFLPDGSPAMGVNGYDLTEMAQARA